MLILLILARSLTVPEFGMLMVIIATLNIIHSLFNGGIPVYAQRESDNIAANFSNTASVIILYKLTSFPLYLLCSLLYLLANSELLLLPFIFLGTGIFIYGIDSIFINYTYGNNNYKLPLKLILISRSILLSVVLLFSFLGISPLIYSLIYLSTSIADFVLSIMIFPVRDILRIKLNAFTSGEFKRVMISTFSIGIGLFALNIYDKIDIVLIGTVIDNSSAGLYSAAYAIYKMPQLLSGALLVPLFTGLSGYSREKKFPPARLIKSTVWTLVLTAIISAVIFYFFSANIVGLLFGENFGSSAGLLIILLPGIPLYFLNNFTGVILNSYHYEKLTLYSSLMAAVFNIGANLILLSLLGLKGAAYSTIFTELFILLIQIYFISQKFRLFGDKN